MSSFIGQIQNIEYSQTQGVCNIHSYGCYCWTQAPNIIPDKYYW